MLFPNKRELFLVVDRHVVDRIRSAFVEAARGHATSEQRLEAMGQAYIGLLADRDEILFQLQVHAAAGDPELGEEVRRDVTDLWEDARRACGAPDDEVRDFIAKGMLLNVAAALELPDELLPLAVREQL